MSGATQGRECAVYTPLSTNSDPNKWHKIFKLIALACPRGKKFTLSLGNDEAEITFWQREYQIYEPGCCSTNYKVRKTQCLSKSSTKRR